MANDGGFFKGLLDSVQNPLFLGGVGLMSNGGEGLQRGLLAGNQFTQQKKKQAQEDSLAAAVLKLDGLDEQDRSVFAASPDLAQTVLTKMYENRIKPTEKTSDQREFEMARQQGFRGTFMEYQTALKRAGAPQTMISTDMRAENAESKARGEGVGKRLNTIADDGFEAQKDAVMLDRIAGLGSNVDPGTKTAAFEAIRAATGIALDPNTDNVQAFQAAVNYMVPRMRVPGSGATSDFDAQTFVRSLPSLYGTPDGNRIITETLGGMNQNRLAAGRIAQRWQRGEITAQQADAEFQKLPDAFASFRKASPGMNQQQAKDLPTMSPAQAARLPAGTRFRGADGKVRVKQ